MIDHHHFLRRSRLREWLGQDVKTWRPPPLNDRTRLALVAVLLIALAVGLVAWVYRPLVARLDAVGAELHRQREDYAYGQTISARLETIEAEIVEAGQRLAALDRRVPPGNDVPEFIRSCGQSARLAGARIWEISVGDPGQSGQYQVQTARLIVTGSYRAQVAFVAGLEDMERLVRIDTVEMVPGEWQEARGRFGQPGASFRSSTPAGNVVSALYEVLIFSEAADASAGATSPATGFPASGLPSGDGGTGTPGVGEPGSDRESPFVP